MCEKFWAKTQTNLLIDLKDHNGCSVSQLMCNGQVCEYKIRTAMKFGVWHSLHWSNHRQVPQVRLLWNTRCAHDCSFFWLPCLLIWLISVETYRTTGGGRVEDDVQQRSLPGQKWIRDVTITRVCHHKATGIHQRIRWSCQKLLVNKLFNFGVSVRWGCMCIWQFQALQGDNMSTCGLCHVLTDCAPSGQKVNSCDWFIWWGTSRPWVQSWQ